MAGNVFPQAAYVQSAEIGIPAANNVMVLVTIVAALRTGKLEKFLRTGDLVNDN